MKKITSILLVVSMILALALTAAAAVGSSELSGAGVNGDTQKPVTVKVQGVQSTSTTYYVVIAWESLDFTYDFKEAGRAWDPEKHEVTVTTAAGSAAGWVLNGKQTAVEGGVQSAITVTNHSNAAVTYTASLTGGTTLAGVAVKLDGADVNGEGAATKTLATGVGKTFDTADKSTFAVAVTGKPSTVANTATPVTVENVSILLEK